MLRIDTDEDDPVVLVGNRQFERQVAPGLPHCAIGHLPGMLVLGNAVPSEGIYGLV